jgi:hypothetical protein
MVSCDLAHLGLLDFNWQRCIHYRQAEFWNHLFVLVDNPALE